MGKGLETFRDIQDRRCIWCPFNDEDMDGDICHKCEEQGQLVEQELKALEIISQNFKLVGNCLHAKNKYAESGWVFVKELEDEEEHNAWKEVLL